ncbi:beta-barrel assembly-enhancing protease [Pararobbsia alpina]|uniref:M48 family metalloprotease n=1 Tax=Pararobbsia alpina TaxID=621374 RepID=UPI0039A47144
MPLRLPVRMPLRTPLISCLIVSLALPAPASFGQALRTPASIASEAAAAAAAASAAAIQTQTNRQLATGSVSIQSKKAAVPLPASALRAVPDMPVERLKYAAEARDDISDHSSSMTALESPTGLKNPFSIQQLPSLGDGSGGDLSPAAERKLGERVMREIRADPDYIDDWLLVDYLNSVSHKLAVAAQDEYLGTYVPNFEVFGVRDPQINAFSLPGGFIGINTGLIQVTQTESELASVMGHEMGHVLQRHIARSISQQRNTGYTALAGLLFGVLAGLVAHSADLGEAMVLGSQALAVDNQLRFSRTAEHEADRTGFRMLAGAGYDPYAMAAFFQRLEAASHDSGIVPAYARTHPLTTDRIADMEDRARRTPYRQPTQNPEYFFVRARAIVLQANWPSDLREVVRRFQSEIQSQTALNMAASWYGVAVAQSMLHDTVAAEEALASAQQLYRAQTKNPNADTPSLVVLSAHLAVQAGRDADALRIVDAARRAWPQSNAVIDAQLEALLYAHRYSQAQVVAHLETIKSPEQPAWWAYLAEASDKVGDTVMEHRAMAERLALRGAWPAATEHLKSAEEDKNVNFYEASAIAARLHQMEAQYKEDQKEKDDFN